MVDVVQLSKASYDFIKPSHEDDHLYFPHTIKGNYYKLPKVKLRGPLDEMLSFEAGHFTASESIRPLGQVMTAHDIDVFNKLIHQYYDHQNGGQNIFFSSVDDLQWLLGTSSIKKICKDVYSQVSDEVLMEIPSRIMMVSSWASAQVGRWVEGGDLESDEGCQKIIWLVTTVCDQVDKVKAGGVRAIMAWSLTESDLDRELKAHKYLSVKAGDATYRQLADAAVQRLSGVDDTLQRDTVSWMQLITKHIKKGSNATTRVPMPEGASLLIRLYSSYPEYISKTSFWHVNYSAFVNLIEPHVPHRYYICRLLGRSQTQSARWETGVYEPKPDTQRLIDILFLHFSRFIDNPSRMRYEIMAWRTVVANMMVAVGKTHFFA